MIQRRSLGVLTFVGLFIILCSPVLADELKVDSKITDVTIYPGAALVTRQAEVNVSSGDHTVLFQNIIPQIDENTLTVKGQGTAEVKIFGASVKIEYLTQASDERVKSLQSKIESVDDEISLENNKQEVLKKQKEYLDSIRMFEKGQIPKDLVTKTPAVADLEQLGTYIAKNDADLGTQGEEIRLKLRELDRKKNALNQELQQLNSNSGNVKRSIAVDIQGVHDGKLSLSVSYLVNGVNWEPVYDARVAFDKNQVDLALFGLVSQSTGEDWSDVRLTISTSRPSIGGVMPELSSWTLTPYQPRFANSNYVLGAMKSASDAIGDQFSPAMGQEVFLTRGGAVKMMKAETVYAQTQQTGLSVVFKITKSVSVKSDGTQQRVPITALTLPAQFEYATTPKLSTYAYLKSQVENNQDAILLSGRVNVFLDGDYVGSSSIPKAIGQKEKFDLYMGADEGVTVKRELVEQKTDDMFIGNIPSANKTNRYTYKITVENYKGKPIVVNLFDQIPVSQDEKIKVKDVKFKVEPTQKDYKDRKGVELWVLNLNAQDKKEISYSFGVESQRDLQVEGL